MTGRGVSLENLRLEFLTVAQVCCPGLLPWSLALDLIARFPRKPFLAH